MNNEAKRSNVDIVRSELANNSPTPRYEMPETTGLKRKNISGVFNYLRRLGELPRPTPEDSLRTMSEAVSSSRGGIRLLIQPYLEQDMKSREIRDMVYLENGIVVDLDKVNSSLRHYKHKSAHPNSGKPLNRKPIEAIEARRTARHLIRALALRQGTSTEIARIVRFAHFTRPQVEAELNELGILLGGDSSKSREGQDRITREEIHNEALTYDFARKIVRAGMITDDLSDWETAQELFRQRGREVRSLGYGICRETFFRARRYMLESHPGMFDLYSRILQAADPNWLEMPDIKDDRKLIMNYRLPNNG